MLEAFEHPVFEKEFYNDKWGIFISAYAPIKDQEGKSVAILGSDVDVSVVMNNLHKRFSIWIWFAGLLCIVLFAVWTTKR
jgi:methyl-accepting chemotaxis protein